MNWNTVLTGSIGGLIAGIILFFLNWLRDYKMQKNSQSFDLAFSTEAAKIVVNKQSEFGEKYLEEFDKLLEFFLEKGPDKGCLNNAFVLSKIRQKYSIWIDEDVDSFLLEFEALVRKIGATDNFLRFKKDSGDDVSEELNEMYDLFNRIFEVSKNKNKEEKIFHRSKFINKLKIMIGVYQIAKNKEKYNNCSGSTKSREKIPLSR